MVRYSLGDTDRVLALSAEDPLLRFQKLTLAPADGFVLSRVDGTRAPHEIVQMIPLPAEVVERSLLGLLSTGVIEYVEGAGGPGRGASRARRRSATAAGRRRPARPAGAPLRRPRRPAAAAARAAAQRPPARRRAPHRPVPPLPASGRDAAARDPDDSSG